MHFMKRRLLGQSVPFLIGRPLLTAEALCPGRGFCRLSGYEKFFNATSLGAYAVLLASGLDALQFCTGSWRWLFLQPGG